MSQHNDNTEYTTIPCLLFEEAIRFTVKTDKMGLAPDGVPGSPPLDAGAFSRPLLMLASIAWCSTATGPARPTSRLPGTGDGYPRVARPNAAATAIVPWGAQR